MFVSVAVKDTFTLPVAPPRTILPFAVVARRVVVVDPKNGLTVKVAV
jgi:hypothetical protein